jgi:hypothetical protein
MAMFPSSAEHSGTGAEPSASGSTEPTRRWWLALAGIVIVAAWLRLCNLGTFSLWLDEVFTMTRSLMPFPQLMDEALADADNMPIYLFITHACLKLGMVDPWLRLVPVAAGLASIVFWSRWALTHFGARMSLLTAGAMTLFTFHVRYSQELRAYPYLLCITGLTMVLADRLRSRPDVGTTLGLASAIALGWYTHLSFSMVLLPLAGVLLCVDLPGASDSPRRAESVRYGGAAILLGTAAFLPWLLTIATTLHARMDRGATELTIGVVKRRWQFLTVAANELEPLSWIGIILAGLFCVGIAVALRRRIGWALVPAVSTVVMCEILYQIVNRWSKPRYYTAVWPFLVILIVLGGERLMSPVRSKALRATVYGTLALILLVQVDGYHRRGRPHWDRMARAVEEARRPGEAVMSESAWVANGIGMYTDLAVTPLRWRTEPLIEALESSPSVLLITSFHRPVNRGLHDLARLGVVLAEIPQTGFLRRMPSEYLGNRSDGSFRWPRPSAQRITPDLEAPLEGCCGRLLPGRWFSSADRRRAVAQIGFDRPDDPTLRSGWSAKTHGTGEAQVRWVLGREAVVDVERETTGPAVIQIRLRAPAEVAEDQAVRVLVNDFELFTGPVPGRPITHDIEVPGEVWLPDRNLLVLQFRRTLTPSELRPLPRAAAVYRITISDSPPR